MAPDSTETVIAELSRLVDATSLTDRERTAGRALLRRISRPVRLMIQGPDEQAANAVLTCLQARFAEQANAASLMLGGTFENADIVVWCTQAFTDSERAMWSRAPNALKDHSFLVAMGPDPALLPHLEDVAMEEFIGFHHLPTGGDTRETAALQHDVARQIEGGIEATRDSAYLFLQQHRAKLPLANPPVSAMPSPATAPPVTPISIAPAPHSPAQPPPRPPAAPAATVKAPHNRHPVFQTAMTALSEHASALLALEGLGAREIGPRVLQSCSNASDMLSEVFVTGDCDGREFSVMRDLVTEAADHLMLMCLENDLSSATDAVTILLQVRKELSVCLAA